MGDTVEVQNCVQCVIHVVRMQCFGTFSVFRPNKRTKDYTLEPRKVMFSLECRSPNVVKIGLL